MPKNTDYNRIDDATIDGITKICNDENFIELVEPHIAFQYHVERWQVRRALLAFGLLNRVYKEHKRRKKNGLGR